MVDAPSELVVSKDEVVNVLNSLNFNSTLSRTQAYTINLICTESGIPGMYVINYLGGGWLIISGNKALPPILASGESGSYQLTPVDKPESLIEWEKGVLTSIERHSQEGQEYKIDTIWNAYKAYPKKQIPSLSKGFSEYDALAQEYCAKWISEGYSVSTLDSYMPKDANEEYFIEDLKNNMPSELYDCWEKYVFVVRKAVTDAVTYGNLVQSTWDQKNEYNQSFPKYDGVNLAAVGCGPIAIGQVMRFFKKPTHYNWSAMPLNSPTKITSDFLYEVAEKAHAKYGNQTPVTTDNMVKTLKEYGYNVTKAKYDYTLAHWAVVSGRPVIVTGETARGMHAWIMSGMKGVKTIEYENLFYIGYGMTMQSWPYTVDYERETGFLYYHNWGWGGLYNDYYYVGDETPGSDDYTMKEILYNLY